MKGSLKRIGSCLIYILLAIVSSTLPSNVNSTCRLQCPLQDRTQDKEFDVGCGPDCKIEQCVRGCGLWEKALQSSCQAVCDGTQELIPPKELYCVMGCNDALNSYLHQVTEEIGTPVAPALVADSLTAKSLSLEWEGSRMNNISYLVQWKYEGISDSWHYCRNQSWISPSSVFIDDLQPYTKYRFRIALVLSVGAITEPIVSEPSLVILTLASGLPRSKPYILTVTATDPTRVSVTWKSGPFPNGPILSYVLSIDELPHGYKAHKDIGASERKFFYMFQNLIPSRNYSVSVAMRNAEGLGPIATDFVSTPPVAQVKEDEKVVLILGGDHTVVSQPADMLVEPVIIYKSDYHIRGVSLDVRKRQLYVCESSGNVHVRSLIEGSKPKLLLTESFLGFEPHFLSVDWLNHLLYILGRAPTGAWHISRCASHNGSTITVAVAGLPSKPIHIQVDPYNGYLFWVVQGPRGGLYRLDLADISNGIKREVRPEAILEDSRLGAFTVDHTNFRVLIASHSLNTVLSVSLDGREISDVRERTQAAQFQQVVGLAWAQDLFYWTDGERLLAEEFHQPTKSYFHNLLYPDSAFSSIALDLETTQPLPVPVNPPTNLQAIMGSDLAKASWNLPHLLAGQGRGAWQSWNYELSVENEQDGNRRTLRGINSTSLRVSRLESDTPYLLRVAAYTEAGRGPWSTPFHAKSLTSSQPKILWSTDEGLVMSEPTGETARTLIHPRSLKDMEGSQQITGISWYEDHLYLLTNASSLYWYNLTSKSWGRLADVDSPGGSIAVDWLGRKIYWSSPKQQLITRVNLNGSQQEPLPILTVAKELNIDAIHGYIYWSTGHSVECSRLNGQQRIIYYNTEIFSGVQVMGLTLDMSSKSVFWIVRSYEGSTLFKATTANQLKPGEQISPIRMSVLQYPDMQGSLCYFDDHLLWLRDDRNAVIGDLSGQNSAVLTGIPLRGINVVQVLDNSLHSFPENLKNKTVNVIPEAVIASSLRVEGPHGHFNITWDPITSVNYGQVFYELKLARPNGKDITVETSHWSWKYRDGLGERRLAPYSLLSVSVRALTYWGTAHRVTAQLHSPPAIPSPPTAPRFYISQTPAYQLFHGLLPQNNVKVTFRWDPPKHPNGPVLEYRVFIYGPTFSELSSSKLVLPSPLEISYYQIPNNSSFYFQVSACTAAGCGSPSKPEQGDSARIHPIPMLLLTAANNLQVLDWDLGRRKDLAQSSSDHVRHLSYSAREKLLYYFDNSDILASRINSNTKFKVVGLNSSGLSIAVDWVGRFLYWSEEGVAEGTSVLKKLDLSFLDQGYTNVTTLFHRPAHILSLQVDPLNGYLYWIELKLNKYTYVQKSRMDGTQLQSFFKKRHRSKRHLCNCPDSPVVDTIMTIDQTVSTGSARFYWVDAPTGNIVVTDENACICTVVMDSAIMGSYGLPATSIGVDESNIYWSNESLGLIYSVTKSLDVLNRRISTFNASGVCNIIPYGQHLQPYPDIKCLILREQINSVAMIERTSTSITLEIPEPKFQDCSDQNLDQPMISVKSILYFGQLSQQGNSQCDPTNLATCESLLTYNSYFKLDGLSPFTRYIFYLAQTNYYMEEANITAKVGPHVVYSTSAGAPPPPEQVNGVVLNPSSLQISWLKPRVVNSQKVMYEVVWQSVGLREGARHSGEQILELNNSESSPRIKIKINKLVPSLTYKIWVRAYAESKDVYSESSIVELEMYPEPRNITLNKATSSELFLSWQKPNHLSHNSYRLEYIGVGSLFDSDIWMKLKEEDFSNGTSYYRLDNLLPKTTFTFRLAINFTNTSDTPYFWPPDNRFTFKTLGDRPSAPGMPVLQQLPGGIYQVTWEPSRDNGAPIVLYWLEGKRAGPPRPTEDNIKIKPQPESSPKDLKSKDKIQLSIKSRNITIDCILFNNCSNDPGDTLARKRRATNSTEHSVIPDEWTLYYNGTETFWILTELSQYDKYKFRVRSKNSYGWSDYSQESGHFDLSTASLLVDRHQITVLLWLLTPAAIILTIFIFVCVFYRHEKEKKSAHLMTMTNTIRIGNTDVELATLRELPRRRNFVQSTNVLYTSADFVPCEADLAMLPHIRREQITLTKFLGSGAFGEVFEGDARSLPNVDSAETRVAIKTLRKGASDVEKGEFLKEAQLMSNFKHPHILELLGVCLDNDPNFIIMELMEGGDLLSYLRSHRPGRGNELNLKDLMSICVDVARGCCYLEEMHFVHRDLACRNCLVSSCDPATRVVKIGDFGLARDIYKNDYYRKEGEGLLPVRWMAPESLVDGVFTCQSDVWSFGVLLWEIMTLGQQPYPARNNLEVLHYVRLGGRLNRPNYANYLMYELMLKCWSFNAAERPTFKYNLHVLEELLKNCSTATLPLNSGEVWREDCEKVQSDGEPGVAKYLELIYDKDDDDSGYEIPRKVDSPQVTTTELEEVSSLDKLLPFVDQPLYYTNANATEEEAALQCKEDSDR